ncbi:hypothetical protein [Streptomyces massasporeus]|uniref:hypothetical protein n=1 Tax=Streptomyces massasporeus TaxID=67324 RepID=UPI0037F21A3A
MLTSRVPAAVDALLEILRDRPALEDVAVVDGPSPVNTTTRRRIHIGWSPTAESAVGLQQSFNGAGARTRDEALTITGYAEARIGDKDMKLARDQVFALVGEIEQALRASDAEPEAPTLRGTVLWAHLTTGDLLQSVTEGSVAGVEFTVTCQARI